MYILDKDINKKLLKLRVDSKLTQFEVASRMKLKPKSGQGYITRIENGTIRHPSLNTILNYLDAVGVSWESFFRELSAGRSKEEHEQLMSTAKLPSNLKLRKKIDRDVRLYATKIKPPQQFYTKVDMDLVKKKIEYKVRAYCHRLNMKEDLIQHYLKFAHKVLRAKKSAPVKKQFQKSGVSAHYLDRVMHIAINTYHTEEKKVSKQKPLRLEKARAMAQKYLKARIEIEPIESEIEKFLIDNGFYQHVLFNSYMNFARVIFSRCKKYYYKDQPLLKQHIAETIRAWLESGLRQELMEKIKDKILAHFESIKPKE